MTKNVEGNPGELLGELFGPRKKRQLHEYLESIDSHLLSLQAEQHWPPNPDEEIQKHHRRIARIEALLSKCHQALVGLLGVAVAALLTWWWRG
jgi:hypothetical protein